MIEGTKLWNVISDNNTHQKTLPKYADTAKRALNLLEVTESDPPQKLTLQKIIPKS